MTSRRLTPLAFALAGALLPAASARAQSAERLDPNAFAQAFPATRLVWASGASASSTYGAGYQAQDAVGRPNVWPRYGDSKGAWACKNQQSPADWLKVTFPPTEASHIAVLVTNRPGAIVKVEADGAVVYEGAPRNLAGRTPLAVRLSSRG